MSAPRTRCPVCETPLYVKLTRNSLGKLVRTTYCDSCERSLDVTSNLARRAALVAVAAGREVA
jgi:hypothetical protein